MHILKEGTLWGFVLVALSVAMVGWMSAQIRLRAAEFALQQFEGCPASEDLLTLGHRFRVWQKVFLDLGGASADPASLTTTLHRAEYLARALYEAQLSKVVSGTETGEIGRAHV